MLTGISFSLRCGLHVIVASNELKYEIHHPFLTLFVLSGPVELKLIKYGLSVDNFMDFNPSCDKDFRNQSFMATQCIN